MKKTFFKAVVATAVVATTMVVSSVAAMAAETITDKATLSFTESDVTAHSAKATSDEDIDFCNYFTVHFVNTKTAFAKFDKDYDGSGTKPYYGEYKTGSKDGYIEFTIDKPGKAKIGARSSSKSEARTVTVFKEDGTALTPTYLTPLNGDALFPLSEVITLPEAGKYKIQADGACNFFAVIVELDNANTTIASTKTQLDAKTYYCNDTEGNYYVIYSVSGDQVDSLSSIALGKDGTAVDATKTSTVYTSVKFSDESELSAADVGGAYLYTVEVTKAQNAPTSISWITE